MNKKGAKKAYEFVNRIRVANTVIDGFDSHSHILAFPKTSEEIAECLEHRPDGIAIHTNYSDIWAYHGSGKYHNRAVALNKDRSQMMEHLEWCLQNIPVEEDRHLIACKWYFNHCPF